MLKKTSWSAARTGLPPGKRSRYPWGCPATTRQPQDRRLTGEQAADLTARGANGEQNTNFMAALGHTDRQRVVDQEQADHQRCHAAQEQGRLHPCHDVFHRLVLLVGSADVGPAGDVANDLLPHMLAVSAGGQRHIDAVDFAARQTDGAGGIKEIEDQDVAAQRSRRAARVHGADPRQHRRLALGFGQHLDLFWTLEIGIQAFAEDDRFAAHQVNRREFLFDLLTEFDSSGAWSLRLRSPSIPRFRHRGLPSVCHCPGAPFSKMRGQSVATTSILPTASSSLRSMGVSPLDSISSTAPDMGVAAVWAARFMVWLMARVATSRLTPEAMLVTIIRA
jgi:hypothetical protein